MLFYCHWLVRERGLCTAQLRAVDSSKKVWWGWSWRSCQVDMPVVNLCLWASFFFSFPLSPPWGRAVASPINRKSLVGFFICLLVTPGVLRPIPFLDLSVQGRDAGLETGFVTPLARAQHILLPFASGPLLLSLSATLLSFIFEKQFQQWFPSILCYQAVLSF